VAQATSRLSLAMDEIPPMILRRRKGVAGNGIKKSVQGNGTKNFKKIQKKLDSILGLC
jgi:hypothetical protein